MFFDHLPIFPILIPLFTCGILLFIPERYIVQRQLFAFIGVVAQLLVAIAIIYATIHVWDKGIIAYLPGNWQAPFGIVLVVDRLSASLLLLTSILGLSTLIYSYAKWDQVGNHYLPLFQFLLLGLNGAFITADLFNLFVFFEVFLAASYGLILHGSGVKRVQAGLHYIAINLIASFLLLIGISMIYSTTGSLNMADIAQIAGQLTGDERRLFEAAAAILGIAFLIKAGVWPLNFWLIRGYDSACAPVAAMFAIMTKVGIYSLLRIGSLLQPSDAPAAFNIEWMYFIGLITMLYAGLGMLSTKKLDKAVGYAIVASTGTLLAALGMPGVTLTGPALFYLMSSVLATAAFFLLSEMITRTQGNALNIADATDSFYFAREEVIPLESIQETGIAIPAPMVFLGLAFITCILVITGLPPMSGFIAKISLLSAAIELSGAKEGATTNAWIFVIAVIVTGFSTLIGLVRIGLKAFWQNSIQVPRLRWIEVLPVSCLLALTITLAIFTGSISQYLKDAATNLDFPEIYIQKVMQTQSSKVIQPKTSLNSVSQE